MSKKVFLFLALAFSALYACKKDDEPKQTLHPGHEYFPAEVHQLGLERIYDVDSIVYRQVTAVPDTFRYQVREVLKDTFIDLSGQLAFVVEKSIRSSDSMSWIPNYNYTINRNKQFAEEFSNNTRYVKFPFPLREGTVFNSNIYNTENPTKSKVHKPNVTYDLNTLHFDSSVTVTVINDSDFLNIDRHIETFATGVGMISKEYVSIDKIVIGMEVKYEGSRYSYRLRSYKK